jgi:hypothetical protein
VLKPSRSEINPSGSTTLVYVYSKTEYYNMCHYDYCIHTLQVEGKSKKGVKNEGTEVPTVLKKIHLPIFRAPNILESDPDPEFSIRTLRIRILTCFQICKFLTSTKSCITVTCLNLSKLMCLWYFLWNKVIKYRKIIDY